MKKLITKQMYEELKKPLPFEAVKKHPTKTFLSSIKAIYVTERLNDVFGCGAWTLKTEHVTTTEKSMVVVKVTFEIPEYGVYYESFGGNDNGGENSKNFDLGDAYKGATTDAITKIGSYLGIAIDVFKGNPNTKPIEKPVDEPIKQPEIKILKYGSKLWEQLTTRVSNGENITKQELKKYFDLQEVEKELESLNIF